MRILITGGAGYIGSQTCKEFHVKGHEVLVYDNLCNGFKEFVKYGDFLHGDICDVQKLRECLRKFKPDGVVHFAAFTQVRESVIDPCKYFKNNTFGTLCLLEAMQSEGIKNIVASSTCAVYGNINSIEPIPENTLKMPVNPYGTSKLFMENIVKDFSIAYGLKHILFRYFNASGCDLDKKIGERNSPPTHVIPIIFETVFNKAIFEVFGKNYPTPDGTCIRDYIHVKDLAIAHIKAIEYLVNNGDNLELNLGTGKGYSVKEIVSGIEKVTGEKINVKISSARAGDPAMLVANSDKAKKILDWIPEFSNLDTILSTAWEWAKLQK